MFHAKKEENENRVVMTMCTTMVMAAREGCGVRPLKRRERKERSRDGREKLRSKEYERPFAKTIAPFVSCVHSLFPHSRSKSFVRCRPKEGDEATPPLTKEGEGRVWQEPFTLTCRWGWGSCGACRQAQ